MPEHEAGRRPGAGGGLRQKAVGLAEASDWKPGRAEVGAGPIQGAGWRAWAWTRRRAGSPNGSTPDWPAHTCLPASAAAATQPHSWTA